MASVAAEIVNSVKDSARVGTIIGLVGFLWGASGFYLSLENALGRFFPSRRGRDPILGRVRSMVAVLLVVAGVLTAFGVSVILSLIGPMAWWRSSRHSSPSWPRPSSASPAIGWCRSSRRSLRAAAPAALLAGLFIGLLTALFGFISSQFFGGLVAVKALTSVFLALVWFGYVFQGLLYGAAFARMRDVQARSHREQPSV